MKSLAPIVPALTSEERVSHMEACEKYKFPLLKRNLEKKFKNEVMTIACYGPSLADTWKYVKHPLMTTSGAHDFLIDGGIVPEYHVECDPREHKTKFTQRPHKETHYLMASVCHPKMWEQIKDQKVSIWHVHNDEVTEGWALGRGQGDSIIAGGSNVGLRAIEVCAALGYRKLHIHGMDCSYRQKRHAGEHPRETEHVIYVTVNGREFATSPILYEGAKEFLEMLMVLRLDIEVTLYGDGLLQELTKVAKVMRKAA